MPFFVLQCFEWGTAIYSKQVWDRSLQLCVPSQHPDLHPLSPFDEEIEEKDAYLMYEKQLCPRRVAIALDASSSYPDGSQAWRDIRAQSVTGSDVPVILGESVYLKPAALLNIKLGKAKRPEPWQPAVEHGNKYEPEALSLFSGLTGIKLRPERPGFVRHPSIPWLGVTTDAFCADEDALVEVKCAYSEKNNNYEHNPAYIPTLHYWQIQAQLFVCDMRYGYYVQYRPPAATKTGCIVLKKIYFNSKRWHSYAMPKLQAFRKAWEKKMPLPVQKHQCVPMHHLELAELVYECCKQGNFSWKDCFSAEPMDYFV